MRYRIGRSQARIEDERLLRGEGRYTADHIAENELSMVVFRSPSASGRILELDVEDARQAPGVQAVFTAADTKAEGFGGFEPKARHKNASGEPMFLPPFHPLSSERVRYVGDPLAVVVAESLAEAEDAAELIVLDIEEEPAIVDCYAALAEGAPAVWPEVPDNRAFVYPLGDKTATEQAFAKADRVIEQRLDISRVIAAPMEMRGVLALYDGETGNYTLRVGTQSPHRIADGLAELMGVEREKMRVIAEDTGGAFGMKNGPYPEYALALLAARKLERPVRWASSRLESFLSDSHAREQIADAALALDEEGRFLGLKVEILANIGAYLGPASTLPMVNNVGSVVGVYNTPAVSVEITGVHSHTQNMAPYRGAGRPEATYIMERMADLAAAELGLDRAEIRRRNMIQPEQMPYRTPLTYTYDSGDFPAVLDEALKAADWQGFEARRAESEQRGRLRGLGIANPIEIAGGPAGKPNPEFAAMSISEEGGIIVDLGSSDSGMGHRTFFAQLLGEEMGMEMEDITFRIGDTAVVKKGIGAFGSRTSAAVSTSLLKVKEEIVRQALPEAAEALETAEADIVFEEGRFTVVGTDKGVGLKELAQQRRKTFSAEAFVAADDCSFPNGCHLCEVEVDPETGRVEVLDYWVVDDVGLVINPLLMAGQIQGGVAQGLGQALMEKMVYDPDSGQLLTASFMDYAMPRAPDLPSLKVASHPVPTPSNPLGVKGVGEAGVVGSLPAVISAICDALSPLGVRHVDMPATPERIWRAIQRAG
ncbi:xanthine dehydrogenase family protein molybdopterin-binding subunit [Limibacillus halophilus]